MTEDTRKDYEILLAHWNRAFALDEEENAETESGDGWKNLAPSEKLLLAARSMKDCKNVLDYGSGSGWAGVIMAKSGCESVICADPAPNAAEMAARYAKLFHVEDRVRPLCVSDAWLSGVPDGAFDGFFCSNVLDVIPPEMAEDVLQNAARVLAPGGKAAIGLNFYMPPDTMEKRGLERRNGNMLYMDGVLRLVSRTDEEWRALFEKYFLAERLEHFSWPGEETETRRLFYLRAKSR